MSAERISTVRDVRSFVRWWNRMQRRAFPILVIVPAVVVLVGVVGYPVVYAALLSFEKWDIYSGTTTFVGLLNYQTAFADTAFWHALLVTSGYVAASIALELVVGFGLALLLHNPFRGASFVRSLLFLPLFVLPVVAATNWQVLYDPNVGPMYFIARLLGTGSNIGLSNPTLALPLLILVGAWQLMPFVFLVLVAGLQGVPLEQYEAARLDGAGPIREFLHITIPWLRPLLLFIIIFRIMDDLRVFDIPFVLTNGGPGTLTEVASLYIYRQSFQYFNFGQAAALSMILLAVVAVIAIILVRVVPVQRHV